MSKWYDRLIDRLFITLRIMALPFQIIQGVMDFIISAALIGLIVLAGGIYLDKIPDGPVREGLRTFGSHLIHLVADVT